jgi:hypothetical protein
VLFGRICCPWFDPLQNRAEFPLGNLRIVRGLLSMTTVIDGELITLSDGLQP